MGRREKNTAVGFALRQTNKNDAGHPFLLPLVALAGRLHDYVWSSLKAPKQASY